LLDPQRKTSRKDDLREALPDEPPVTEGVVEFRFRLTDEERIRAAQISAQKFFMLSDDPTFSISGKTASMHQVLEHFSDVYYHVNVAEEARLYQYRIPNEIPQPRGTWFKFAENCPPDFEEEINGRTIEPNNGFLFNSNFASVLPQHLLTPATPLDVEEAIGKSVNQVGREEHLKCIFWEYDEKNLLPAQVAIDSFAKDPSSCAPLRNMFVLAGITDIPKTLSDMQQTSRNRAQNALTRIAAQTTAHFKSVWSEYENIEFQLQLDSDKIIPGVKEKNSFDFAKRSDGFKRFVTFLLMVSMNVKTNNLTNTLLLIDEPDFGLHPSGSRYLRDELLRISSKNYVVYSTHSIFMIDTENIGRHYVVKKKEEVTHLEQAKESNIADEEVLFNALGYSVLEVLKEKNLVFEGWRDKRLFLVASAKLTGDQKKVFRDVGVCHANGARHLRMFSPLLELGRRGCLILSDSDTAAKEHQKNFVADKCYGAWMTYQDIDKTLKAITGEDFVRKDYLLSCANDVFRKIDVPRLEEMPDVGRLASLARWGKQHGLSDDATKEALNTIKTAVFENLTTKNIEDVYATFLSGVAKALA